ncbi:MAG: CoA protein activase [Firmicutes bacterium]|nr:CoA protein activase [Bacillota bacterium]
MKVTFPHLGNAYIPIEALLQGLGHEPVTPPFGSKRTLEWGSLYSPEETCLPFKIILGNMLEGIALGANSVYMLGGWGPCRLGYYAEIQRIILADMGKQVEFVTLEVPRGGLRASFERLRQVVGSTNMGNFIRGARLCWAKLKAVEDLENWSLQARPREKSHGVTSKLLQAQLRSLQQAQSMAAIEKVRLEAKEAFQDVTNPAFPNPLRVGVLGEIYTVVEPLANYRLEERLGYLGVEVVRTISLKEWVQNHIFKKAVGLYSLRSLKKSAAGYLRGFIGGHGLESVARSVDLANQNLAGIVHILPMSCMPEIVAQGIMPQISSEQNIPILSLVVDEHAGETGFQTRLEAFVDLLQRRVG